VRYSVTLSVPILEPGVLPSISSAYGLLQTVPDGEFGSFTTNTPYTMLLAQPQVGALSLVNGAGDIVPVAGNYRYDWTCHVGCSGVTLDQIKCDFQLNGSSVLAASDPPTIGVNSASGSSSLDISGFGIVTCGGSDVLNLIMTPTYSAGNCTAWAELLLTAI
jgi:hypothetical protein